jgi:endoglucanase
MLDGVSAKPPKKSGGGKPKPSVSVPATAKPPAASPEPGGSYSIQPVLPTRTPTTAKPPASPVVPPPADKPSAPPAAAPGTGPLTGTSGLYVDPESNPAEWAAAHPGDPRAARISSAIGAKPIARWFGGWNTDVRADTAAYVGRAAQAGKMPVLVAYNIPGRDCGGYSGGGAANDTAYLAWIDGFAKGIGTRPALVVVEPDAVAQVGCLPAGKAQDDRLALIRTAVQRIKAAAPNAQIYLDAGNANWIDAAAMADRLIKAGLGDARGFALNVSNDDTTAASSAYGGKINQALQAAGKKTAPFVVDTSRNGNGDRGDWCNPAGRKLGANPAPGAGGTNAPELVLWLKVPGDSDGTCGIAPGTPAGEFDPALAIRLIDGT